MERGESPAEGGDVQVAGVQTHLSGRESDQQLVWVRSTESVAHMTTDRPHEAPLVLRAVHHQLQRVAPLPQVLGQTADNRHQVLVSLVHEGVGGGGGGAHHGGVAVLLVYDVHQSPDGGEVNNLHELERLQNIKSGRC